MKTLLAFTRSWTVPVKARASISVVSLLFSLSGCSHYYYFNASQNVNVFKEKGDAYVSLGMDSNQGGISAGYAFTDNIGVIGTYRGFNRVENDSVTITTDDNGDIITDYKLRHKSRMVEPELVLTKGIDLGGKPGARLAGSLNVGFAHAGVKMRNQDFYSLKMNRVALQPALCYTNDRFDLGLSARFSRLRYNLTLPQLPTADSDLGDVGRQPYNFIEPAITIGVGNENVRFRAQYLLAMNQTDAAIKYRSQSVYLSINLTLNTRKESK